MNVREYLNESTIFLRDFIAVACAVAHLAKRQGVTAQEMATWFLQKRFYEELMTLKIDHILGAVEIVHDRVDERQLVSDCLRKIARDGLSAKDVTSNEGVVGWRVEDLNKKLDHLGFAKCEFPIEECLTTGSQAEELDVRERDSLLKLVIGMAVGGYGHNPTAKKSSTVSEILQDVEKLGLVVSDETVRKYLKEAASLLRRPE